ncbi:MAG: hypothetical protein IPM36_09860 [Lewinellaceae bacterium]|nr:hypothetical protein [Lewinellaceae bacterium]
MAAYLDNLYRIGTQTLAGRNGLLAKWAARKCTHRENHVIPLANRETRWALPGAYQWAHAVFATDFQLAQCLFGEHQLQIGNTGKKVALVESEKTAVLMSGLLPDYIWLATGGLRKSIASRDKKCRG